jgi:dipeptidyl-peptidase-4
MFAFPTYKVGVAVAPMPDQRLYDTPPERYMGCRGTPGLSDRIVDQLRGRVEGKAPVYGSGDDNVHYQGTERLVNRLVELGKPFDLMVYPNRTHAIAEGPGTTPHVYHLIARYFLEHLPAGER